MAEFRHVRAIGRFAGSDFPILTPGDLKRITPLVQTRELLGAIYEPLDGHVDSSRATHAMASGARAAGAAFYRHDPVEAIERTASGEWILRTGNGDIAAETVVNAAGAKAARSPLRFGEPPVAGRSPFIVTGTQKGGR